HFRRRPPENRHHLPVAFAMNVRLVCSREVVRDRDTKHPSLSHTSSLKFSRGRPPLTLLQAFTPSWGAEPSGTPSQENYFSFCHDSTNVMRSRQIRRALCCQFR
ncbi:unnamed protein product, partial [Ectocarpus sp. 13 AM-2016]